MSLAARFFGKSVWWPANLIASAFYGDASLKFGFARYTIVGAALILFFYGAVGIVFGLLWRERLSGAGTLAASLVVAVLAYYLLFKTVWHHYTPEGAIYAADRQIFLGHVFFALFLARYPRYQRQLGERIPEPEIRTLA